MNLIDQARLLLFFALFGCAMSVSAIEPDVRLSLSVVKVIASTEQGKSHLGSGVIVAPGKVATNCHVTRDASKIMLSKSGHVYPVVSQAALPELDVCILETGALPLPSVSPAPAKMAKGTPVYMYGYPYALGMRSMPASVVAFHPHLSGEVIEIDAGFMHGASGGGIFNEAGELVGLTTFIGKHDQRYHYYAIPADWLIKAMQEPFLPIHAFKSLSFWEDGSFQPQSAQ